MQSGNVVEAERRALHLFAKQCSNEKRRYE